MSKSVVLVKIAYYKPGDKARSNNARHIEYIANKPEADRGDELSLRIGDDDYHAAPGTAAGHVEYAAGRPGSSGLFGPEEGDPAPDWREVARELARHDLPVWRVIVSMREDDAVRLGFTGRARWEAAIREGVLNAARRMQLNSAHVRWVAAYHAKQGHPHCHVVIWETPHRGARRQGRLLEGERKAVWRAFAKELFADERMRLMVEKTALRDTVRDLAGNDVAKAAETVREIRGKARLEVQALDGGQPGVPPVLREDKQAELARRLAALARVMPGQGRVALAYMPEHVKDQAREIAEWLLRQPRFVQTAGRYAELARELAAHYSKKPEVAREAGQKAFDDLRDRVAQVVLRGAAVVNRQQRQTQLEQERLARSVWRSAWRVAERERRRVEAQAQLASLRETELAEERARLERERQIDGGRL